MLGLQVIFGHSGSAAAVFSYPRTCPTRATCPCWGWDVISPVAFFEDSAFRPQPLPCVISNHPDLDIDPWFSKYHTQAKWPGAAGIPCRAPDLWLLILLVFLQAFFSWRTEEGLVWALPSLFLTGSSSPALHLATSITRSCMGMPPQSLLHHDLGPRPCSLNHEAFYFLASCSPFHCSGLGQDPHPLIRYSSAAFTLILWILICWCFPSGSFQQPVPGPCKALSTLLALNKY